jgi:hypothetical protein
VVVAREDAMTSRYCLCLNGYMDVFVRWEVSKAACLGTLTPQKSLRPSLYTYPMASKAFVIFVLDGSGVLTSGMVRRY